MGTLGYFMKCKYDIVVGTHPEDISSYFFFSYATGDQSISPFEVKSKIMLNVKMFNVVYNIK